MCQFRQYRAVTFVIVLRAVREVFHGLIEPRLRPAMNRSELASRRTHTKLTRVICIPNPYRWLVFPFPKENPPKFLQASDDAGKGLKISYPNR
jgi:hypothetical protein